MYDCTYCALLLKVYGTLLLKIKILYTCVGNLSNVLYTESMLVRNNACLWFTVMLAAQYIDTLEKISDS